MESEAQRLERVYREFGDEDLLALDPGDLTYEGERILRAEMKRRKIAPPLRVNPPIQQEVEKALVREVRAKGFVLLEGFHDGIEMGQACGYLEEAGIEPVVEIIPAAEGSPETVRIWLDEQDLERGKIVLREKRGLFPLPEVREVGGEIAGEKMILAQLDSAEEAQQVGEILGQAGIGYFVEEMPEDGVDSKWYSIEVDGTDLVRGLELVAKGFGVAEDYE